MNALPKKGEVYRYPSLRGLWTVRSCGPAEISLKPNQPHLRGFKMSTTGFLAQGWERVR